MHLVSRLRRVSAVVIVLLGLLAGLGAASARADAPILTGGGGRRTPRAAEAAPGILPGSASSTPLPAPSPLTPSPPSSPIANPNAPSSPTGTPDSADPAPAGSAGKTDDQASRMVRFDPGDGSKPIQTTVKTGTLAAPPAAEPWTRGLPVRRVDARRAALRLPDPHPPGHHPESQMDHDNGLDAEPGPRARRRDAPGHQPARQAGALLHQHPGRRRAGHRPDRRRPHPHMDAGRHTRTGPPPRPGPTRAPLPAGRSRQPTAGRPGIRPADLHPGQPTINARRPRHRPGHRVHQHQHGR